MDLPHYKSSGARALVELHEVHLRAFVPVWHEAKLAGVKLPKTEDPDYQTLEHVLNHVCRAARGYMTWFCEVLELPEPNIHPAPGVAELPSQVDDYVNHVLDGWRVPLADVPEERIGKGEYESRWGEMFTIDSMLEHAVMHPIRHGHQLRKLTDGS